MFYDAIEFKAENSLFDFINCGNDCNTMISRR